MSAYTLTVTSDDLARIFTNALAFFPARGVVNTALLRVDTYGRLEATGTDTYTVGRDHCFADVWDFPDGIEQNAHVPIELDREGWSDIEKQARKDKGNPGKLEFLPGDALIFYPGGQKAEKGVARDMTGKETTRLVNGETLESRDVWDLTDELLERLEARDLEPVSQMGLDPKLFTRFNKVRTPVEWDGEAVADFHFQGGAEPVLVKVGPSFVGAIMPIDREVYAENQPEGQDALW